MTACKPLTKQVASMFLVWSLSEDKQPSYKDFPAVGAFSHKISTAPSGETTDRIKKSWGMQKWDGPPLLPCQVWWGSWVARRLSVCFLSRFGMTKFVITETLWSSIIFKTFMVLLHRGRFVVVHLRSSFPIDPRIFYWGAIFTQNSHFWRFWGP